MNFADEIHFSKNIQSQTIDIIIIINQAQSDLLAL